MARNRYPEETVAKILDAAFELFIANGYEGTSIQDIVDHLDGLSKGAIYHHFKGKEEIFEAAANRRMASALVELRRVRDDRSLTGAQKMMRFLDFSSAGLQLDLWQAMGPDPDPVENARLLGIEYRDTFEVSSAQFLLPVIEEGVRDGSIVCAHPREAADILSLLANLWLVPLFGSRGTVEEFRRRAVCFVAVGRALGIEIDDAHLRLMVDHLSGFFGEGARSRDLRSGAE